MESLALLLVVPLIWPWIAKAIWGHELTLREIGINLAVGVVIVVAGWVGGRYAQTHDVELLNGQVMAKASKRVDCDHTYECNCSYSKDSQGRETKTCQTCTEHLWDVNWLLSTDVGDIKIDRVDRRGTTEPPRFTRAAAGDPVAKQHSFVNYVKAAPDSLFNTLAEKSAFSKFEKELPSYPGEVYDYHYANRVLAVSGAKVPDAAKWNTALANVLKRLGPAKQANAILVFTGSDDPNFALALRSAWLQAKKNDVVVIMGTPQYPAIAWTRVISWTDNQLFKVELQDAIQDLQTASPETVIPVLSDMVMKGFVRKPMADFEYLKWSIEPPLWLLVTLFLVSLLASVFTSIKLASNSERSGSYTGNRFGRPRAWR